MRTTILLSAMAVIAVSVIAVTPSSDAVSAPKSSSTTGTNQSGFGGLTFTNRSGQVVSSEDIQNQLAELRRAIEEATPVLSAVTQSYSNSAAAQKLSVAEGIAGVLGGILAGNTNKASGESASGSTNALGRILQGVLGATTNAAPVNAAEFKDLVALQQHLQAVGPILQRLGVSTNASGPSAVGGAEDKSASETGEGRRDQQ